VSLADHEIEDDRPDEPPCAGIERGCTCDTCLAAWRDLLADRAYDDQLNERMHHAKDCRGD
jgi:hypothetical protein